MQGSLEEWIEKGGPSDYFATDKVGLDPSSASSYPASSYPVRAMLDTNLDSVIAHEEMLLCVRSSSGSKPVILDSRGSSFLKQGCMPGAIHVPYKALADGCSTVKLKTPGQLMNVFLEAGVDPSNASTQIICTCGSGVSACTLYLALIQCGRQFNVRDAPWRTRVYDGSWQEWKLNPEAPKVKPISCLNDGCP
jgi:thiosulfate/3-mercaptopyruvate sulfurtransferase